MTRRAYLTPDILPDDTPRVIRLYIPDSDHWRQVVRGALLPMADPCKWEQFGSATPDQSAQLWLDCIRKTFEMRPCLPVGAVIYLAGDAIPGDALLCDGAEYLQADYPDLYAVVGSKFGVAAGGYFRVPSLEKRFILGSGNGGAVGDTGGAENVTLTVDQIPSHHHSTASTLPSMAQLGAGDPVLSPGALPDSTGNTGGGQSHDNMPPYLCLTPVIYWR